MSRRRALRFVAWTVAAVALLAVFAAWRRPAAVVDLANRLWSCF